MDWSQIFTGISSQIGTKLRGLAVWQAGAGCYSQAALSSNDSKTLYTLYCQYYDITSLPEHRARLLCVGGGDAPPDGHRVLKLGQVSVVVVDIEFNYHSIILCKT